MNEKIKGKRVMVVDDESDLTLFFSMTSEYQGFVVDAFNDSRNALSSFKPDYFLTASELYYEEFREKEYNALDKNLFIRKPIGNDELIKEINRFVENKEVV